MSRSRSRTKKTAPAKKGGSGNPAIGAGAAYRSWSRRQELEAGSGFPSSPEQAGQKREPTDGGLSATGHGKQNYHHPPLQILRTPLLRNISYFTKTASSLICTSLFEPKKFKILLQEYSPSPYKKK